MTLPAGLKLVADALGHIIAPRTCEICGCTLTTREQLMCLKCALELPRTRISTNDFNELHKRLGSAVALERAGAWFIYDRTGPYANLIRNAKYYDRPRQARLLGRMMAEELTPEGFFDGMDVVVPVPMWWWKEQMRGFNQSEEIARGIAEVTGMDVSFRTLKAHRHSSQTRFGAAGRVDNAKGTITLRDSSDVGGRHILLVDDIITTGSTMQVALKALSEASPSAISVLALAMTKR